MGITASVACAIHCAAMPFVVALLPMLGLSFLADESFHQVMVVVCSGLAAAAFLPGLQRHRRLLPVGIAAVGLSMISAAAFGLEGDCCVACESPAVIVETAPVAAEACSEAGCEHCELAFVGSPFPAEPRMASFASLFGPATTWITPLGGLLLVSAHLTNRRFSNRCDCCPSLSAT